jgi:hypothetical protein
MRKLNTINGIDINIGDGMARGLYNLSRGENTEEITLWFDEEELDRLMGLNENEFKQEFEQMVEHVNGSI